MPITANIKRVSTTGSKVVIEFTNGSKSREVMFQREDFSGAKTFEEALDDLQAIMKHEIKKAGATTPAQIKSVIESAEYFL